MFSDIELSKMTFFDGCACINIICVYNIYMYIYINARVITLKHMQCVLYICKSVYVLYICKGVHTCIIIGIMYVLFFMLCCCLSVYESLFKELGWNKKRNTTEEDQLPKLKPCYVVIKDVASLLSDSMAGQALESMKVIIPLSLHKTFPFHPR